MIIIKLICYPFYLCHRFVKFLSEVDEDSWQSILTTIVCIPLVLAMIYWNITMDLDILMNIFLIAMSILCVQLFAFVLSMIIPILLLPIRLLLVIPATIYNEIRKAGLTREELALEKEREKDEKYFKKLDREIREEESERFWDDVWEDFEYWDRWYNDDDPNSIWF